MTALAFLGGLGVDISDISLASSLYRPLEDDLVNKLAAKWKKKHEQTRRNKCRLERRHEKQGHGPGCHCALNYRRHERQGYQQPDRGCGERRVGRVGDFGTFAVDDQTTRRIIQNLPG